MTLSKPEALSMERCPGVGFHAADAYGNPSNACPVCSKWVRLSKHGKVPYHKRPVGLVSPPAWYRKAVSG